MSILYKSTRIGKNGKPFVMYKFRTMIEGADSSGVWSTSEDDPRITKVGKILRATKLDELPQIINVLKGEMEICGPRPEVPEFVNKMTEEERRVILSIKPGMTDLASLWDINESARLKGQENPDEYYEKYIWPEKKKLQIEYIKTKSLWLDTKIIVKTIFRILFGK